LAGAMEGGDRLQLVMQIAANRGIVTHHCWLGSLRLNT
jgi:hypothetical protein